MSYSYLRDARPDGTAQLSPGGHVCDDDHDSRSLALAWYYYNTEYAIYLLQQAHSLQQMQALLPRLSAMSAAPAGDARGGAARHSPLSTGDGSTCRRTTTRELSLSDLSGQRTADPSLPEPGRADAEPSQLSVLASRLLGQVRAEYTRDPRVQVSQRRSCQYRHHSPDSDGEPRVACRYQTVGCNVRTSPSRLQEHELLCIYKDRLPEGLEDRLHGSCNIAARPPLPVNLQICPQGPAGDPNELVECRYRSQGCMMRVPRWNRAAHEDKCNYNTVHGHHPHHHQQQMPADVTIELRDCRYAARGCRIRSPLHSLARHEATCQYADNRQQVVYPHQAHNVVVVPQPRHEEWVDCRYAPQGCRVKSKYFARNAHESVCTYRHQRITLFIHSLLARSVDNYFHESCLLSREDVPDRRRLSTVR
ncbi:unnamed protein product [Trichogramma brassicae]|uniref:Uncharacterized protein n=1 Tax=Trichogramma brassicae TaxID=86971 RepID=A0A6H5I7W7_9HYME|nr:unnamed protein product [Trichogramma brassicae]